MNWLIASPFAHRGLFSNPLVPENSMAAFKEAIGCGYGIELDVRCLQDGSIAVFHDRRMKRLTSKSGLIENQTAESIRSLRLFGTLERIPLLQEVLEFIDGRVPVLIELKNTGVPGGPEEALSKVLVSYKGQFGVMSPNPESVRWFLGSTPRFACGLVLAKRTKHRHGLLENEISALDFLACDVRLLPCHAATLMRTIGKPVLAWTIKDPRSLAKAARFADNIIFEKIRPGK